MTDAACSLRATIAALSRGWQSFFYAPCDARICALVRMGCALVLLMHLVVLYPDRVRWFTDEGVLTAETSRLIAHPHAWSLLWVLPSTPAVIDWWFGAMFLCTAMLLGGLLPRVSAAALFLGLVSLQMRNTHIMDGEDKVMRMMAFFLIWMPSGRCWSVNAAVRKWLGRGPLDCLASGWGLRLLQLQMAGVLFSTGLSKLAGEEWLDGTALHYVSRLDDYFGRFPVPAFLFDTPWTVALMTWSVILVELCVPVLIWFRETRRWCLVVLLVFHLANEWTMHLFLFHWIMLVGWLSYLTSDDLAIVGRLFNPEPEATAPGQTPSPPAPG